MALVTYQSNTNIEGPTQKQQKQQKQPAVCQPMPYYYPKANKRMKEALEESGAVAAAAAAQTVAC